MRLVGCGATLRWHKVDLLRVATVQHAAALLAKGACRMWLAQWHGARLAAPAARAILHGERWTRPEASGAAWHAQNEDEAKRVRCWLESSCDVVQLRQHLDELVLALLQLLQQLA